MKVLLVNVTDKKSCLYFHYKQDFVKKLSLQKKKYGLFWSTDNKRWEFNTETKDGVMDFLQNELEALVITDDHRKDSKDQSSPYAKRDESSPNCQVEKVKMYDQIKTPSAVRMKKPAYTMYSDEEDDEEGCPKKKRNVSRYDC